MTAQPVLSVRDLVVEIPTRHSVLRPVNGVSFDLAAGEILGIVGESGAGKSMTGNAVIGLLDRPAHIASGTVHMKDRRIDNLGPGEIRKIRGRDIGMIFQDPLTSLNPLLSIGDQLTETICEHLPLSEDEARNRAINMLEEVGIAGAAERIHSYPHQFSGGMRQRVVIALALCTEPAVVIADEPTTALDVSVQAQITFLLKRLCKEHGTGVILVTHDMGVIAETADRVGVMYAGRMVELGAVEDVLTRPRHPYTAGLMASTPLASQGGERLNQIPGAMPRLDALPEGCPYHPRCSFTADNCLADPAPTLGAHEGKAACWYPLKVTTGSKVAGGRTRKTGKR